MFLFVYSRMDAFDIFKQLRRGTRFDLDRFKHDAVKFHVSYHWQKLRITDVNLADHLSRMFASISNKRPPNLTKLFSLGE